MTFERLLFVFRFFQKPFLMSRKQKRKSARGDFAKQENDKKENKNAKASQRDRSENTWPFTSHPVSRICQAKCTRFAHHLATKSHIPRGEISSPNSLLVNLNPTKHSF